ncbi:DUF2975 domain-containing protein [Lacrimispora sp.]|uniref:DUF2975 domain-containing protein n=1 Tax=Lacrimispora sp. TaxID=2719234 RepID=UPI00346022F4
MRLPLFYSIAKLDNEPGLIFFGLTVVLIVTAIAAFIYVLQYLFQQAIDNKVMNDGIV